MKSKEQNRVLCHSLGDSGVTYTVHIWLVGKRVIDILLVLVELFFAGWGAMSWYLSKMCCLKARLVALSANFWWKKGRCRPWTNFGVREINCCLCDPTFSHIHTHTHTHTPLPAAPSLLGRRGTHLPYWADVSVPSLTVPYGDPIAWEK